MKLSTYKNQHSHYQYIATKQFKSRVLTIRFFSDIPDENITARYLMLMMLKAKTQRHPTRKILSKHLETLYDTILVGQASKFGTKHVNQLSLIMIDDRYTIERTLFSEGLALIKDVLYQPKFDEVTLEEEKQFLKAFFQSEYTNKTRYAYKRYRQHLMENYPYNAHPYGDETKIDAITLDMITKSYHRMLTQNQVFVSIVGDFDVDALHQEVLEALPLTSQPSSIPILYRHTFTSKPAITEVHDVTQNRLFLTLKSDVFFRDKDYFTMLVFNAMFGEGSESILFKTVREKHALAYYVSSSYSPFTGLITLMSGMDKKQIDAGKALMLSCLTLIQQGNFTDEDITLAKTQLISQFKQSYDASGALSQKALRTILFDLPFKEDIILENIANVEKHELIEIANNLKLIFAYELGGVNDENDSL